MKRFKNELVNFLLWFLSIIFLEFSFIFFMHKHISGESAFNIIFYSIITSSILSIITNIVNNKITTIIKCFILFILGILFSIQCVFYNVFKVYFSFSNIGLGDQVSSFMKEAFKYIKQNILFIIIFMLPFIFYLIFRKKINLKANEKKSYLIYFLILFVSITIFVVHAFMTRGRILGTYELYNDVNEISLNIEKLGVLNSYQLDLHRQLFGFNNVIKNVDIDNFEENNNEEEKEEEKVIEYTPNTLELNLSKDTNDNNIKKINEYISNDKGTMKNKYTGIFKNYNLIYITAESFSEIGISKELTPTLYKLVNTGFIFDNYYTPNALSTIGGEFQSVLGLYPDSDILSIWRSGKNYFPYGLGNIFKKLGYNTYAYHNNSYVFQDRNKYLASIGFNNFIGCYNGMEKRMNCNQWPESDDAMMKVTIPDYINSDKPFLAYYMTVSGHFEYTFSDNCMAAKHKDAVSNLKVNNNAKAYVATQIELDKALERLLKELEKNGKLDNTVIVLLADHYPYDLDLATINSLSDFKRDEIIGVNKNSLIIWNNSLEDIHISKPCMSSDVLPTVYNLFGIDYDSRLYTGRDILSDSFGIAIMRNRSWITDKGKYYANTNKFVGSDVDSDYIKKINSLVNSRLNISKLILKTDYYRYLFK